MLGIESSCDETGVAIVCEDGSVLADSLVSQWPLHHAQGGVVPTIAVREHTRYIDQAVERVIREAGLVMSPVPPLYPNPTSTPLSDQFLYDLKPAPECMDKQGSGSDVGIDAIAVTAGPGLAPCLEVGLSKAKQLARIWNLPLLTVNHIEAHALVATIPQPTLSQQQQQPQSRPTIDFPYLALVVSGGHTQFNWTRGLGDSDILGSTLDDAVGEAFDKVCNLVNAYTLDLDKLRELCKGERTRRGLPSYSPVLELKQGHPRFPGEGSAEAISPKVQPTMDGIPQDDIEFITRIQSVPRLSSEVANLSAMFVSHDWQRGLLTKDQEQPSTSQDERSPTAAGSNISHAPKMPLPAGAVIEQAAEIYEDILSILSVSTPHLVAPDRASTLEYVTPRVLGLDSPHIGHPLLPIVPLPQPLREPNAQPYGSLSFSGIKSAVRRTVESYYRNSFGWDGLKPLKPTPDLDIMYTLALACAFQRTVNAHISQRTQRIVEYILTNRQDSLTSPLNLVVAGGVAANQSLVRAIRRGLQARASQLNGDTGTRERMKEAAVVVPSRRLCTDNGIMTAWAGVRRLASFADTKGDSLWTGFQQRWPVGPHINIPRPLSQNQLKRLERLAKGNQQKS